MDEETPIARFPPPAQVGDKNIPPTTTATEDLTLHGQRRVNLIWETVQGLIAAAVVGTALSVSAILAMMTLQTSSTESQTAVANTAFMLIANLVSLVIGFYFGRTNHQKTGGVGSRDEGR